MITLGSQRWTAVGFNIRDSSPSYGTIEGLAIIGGLGDFPPTNVEMTITSFFEGPRFESADYSTPICMAAGTEVSTPDGLCRAEDIEIGDLVPTRDHGVQQVRWH